MSPGHPMTTATRNAPMSFRQAFEAEHARRDAERHEREETERLQQEADLARAEQLYESLAGDPGFLADKGLTVDRRRYTVTLDHADFRISAYFEAGRAVLTSSDKRNAVPGAASQRKQEMVDTVDDALRVMAQYLADETH